MPTGDQQLINKWEARSMEEEGCRCGCQGGSEAGFHLQHLNLPHVPQRETTGRRMAQILAAVILLLVSAFVIVVIVVTFDRQPRCQCHAPPHNQTTTQPDGPPSGGMQSQMETRPNQHVLPSALITSPEGNITDGKYLRWNSHLGNAYCEGVTCSDVEIVVPTDGLYRVFLQVTYEGGEETCGKPVILQASVLYQHDSYGDGDRCFLSSYDTVICNNSSWIKSLYTSGTFQLDANGKLRVNTTSESLILKNEHQTFFGVELLSSS